MAGIHIGDVLMAMHALAHQTTGPDDLDMHECIDNLQEYLGMSDRQWEVFEFYLGIGIIVGRQDIIRQLHAGTEN